jgi:hypothetical protein
MFETLTKAFQSLVKVFNPVLLQKKLEKQAGIKKDLYLIELATTFKCRYVVRCSEGRVLGITAEDTDELVEFSQEYLGGKITDCFKLKDESHYLNLFDEDNEYLDGWNKEDKLSFINDVNEE